MIPENLLKTAVVGTERGSIASSDFLAYSEGVPAEQQLLRLTGLLHLRQRVGWLPSSADIHSNVPPVDERPVCHESAVKGLSMMLEGQFHDFLSQWLKALAQAGQRIPGELLHKVLNKGDKYRALRPLIRPVMGKTAYWLATYAEGERWLWVQPDINVEKYWDRAPLRIRGQIIEVLREQQPERARELLQSIWETIPASARAEGIKILKAGLSMNDEPFLEKALDDVAENVRLEARELLARLVDSRYMHRMIKRLERVFTFNGKELSVKRDAFKVPDMAFKRDLVIENRSYSDDSSPLSIALSVVPPAYWCKKWRLTPYEFATYVRKQSGMVRFQVFTPWDKAIHIFKDSGMAVSFLALSITPEVAFRLGYRNWLNDRYFLLESIIPTYAFEKLISMGLETYRDPYDRLFMMLELMKAWQKPWTKLMADFFVEVFEQAWWHLSHHTLRLAQHHLVTIARFIPTPHGRLMLNTIQQRGFYLAEAFQVLEGIIRFREFAFTGLEET